MPLPQIAQSSLDLPVIDWAGRSRRYLNSGELEVLIALVASVSPRTVVEIGCNEGRTARAILDYVHGIESYIGVDVPPSYAPELLPVQRYEVPQQPGHLAAQDERFVLMVRPRGSRDLNPTDVPPADAVFIDGDHSAAGVVYDTGFARRITRPGGIIIWHDYHALGTVDVKRILDAYYRQGDQIFHVANTWLAFERR